MKIYANEIKDGLQEVIKTNDSFAVFSIACVEELIDKKSHVKNNIDIKFEDDVLDFIVEKAIEFKLGARGLRSICEAIMTDLMFDLPSDTKVKEYTVTAEYAKARVNKLRLSRLKAA